jgi:hypothetical protein
VSSTRVSASIAAPSPSFKLAIEPDYDFGGSKGSLCCAGHHSGTEIHQDFSLFLRLFPGW